MVREPEREGRFAVRADEAGARLDVVLAARAGLSRAAAQRLIEDGRVTVDGRPARKRHALRLGEDVAWQRGPEPRVALTAEDVPYDMVYEDDWLLVVDKPAGVVVHPAPGHEHGTLAQGLVEHGARGGHELRPGIVHRLDKDTSGLLIVAKGDHAYQALVAAMERRDIKRVYVTHFRVLGRAPGFTLVRVQLETGRTHQIRVHFAALGYPVAGDAQYGGRERPEGLGRQFLHAAQLAFPHPDDGRQMSFASPLPPDLWAFLASLGLPTDPRL